MAKRVKRGNPKRIPLEIDIDIPEEKAIWEAYQEHGIAWVREIILKGMKPSTPEQHANNTPSMPHVFGSNLLKTPFDNNRPATPIGRSFSKEEQVGKKRP